MERLSQAEEAREIAQLVRQGTGEKAQGEAQSKRQGPDHVDY